MQEVGDEANKTIQEAKGITVPAAWGSLLGLSEPNEKIHTAPRQPLRASLMTKSCDLSYAEISSPGHLRKSSALRGGDRCR